MTQWANVSGAKQALSDDASALGGYESEYQRRRRLHKTQPVFIDFPERTKKCSIPKKGYTCPVHQCTDPDQDSDAGLHLALKHKMAFCCECGVFCQTREHLIYHLQNHHLRDTTSCPECETEVFGHFLSLARHCLDQHGVFLCPVCPDGPVFRFVNTYQAHITKYHSITLTKVFGKNSWLATTRIMINKGIQPISVLKI